MERGGKIWAIVATPKFEVFFLPAQIFPYGVRQAVLRILIRFFMDPDPGFFCYPDPGKKTHFIRK